MLSRNNIKIIKKPYCKVCFDTGKSESEYTSHWVRGIGKGLRILTVYIFSGVVAGIGLSVLMHGFPPGIPEEVVNG